uniref:Uncharacterized protein n=1 Tax=Anguilla anguilla TaxID=7936 RepID=A0A0E9QWJ5_ANGAN
MFLYSAAGSAKVGDDGIYRDCVRTLAPQCIIRVKI